MSLVYFYLTLNIHLLDPDGVELMIIIVGTFAQALSGQAAAVKIIGVLVVWRFLNFCISVSSS